MKKIVILTLPFNDNYGGIIQSVALQRALKSINIESNSFKYLPKTKTLKQTLGWLLYYFKNRYLPCKFLVRIMKGHGYYFRSFMRRNLKETSLCLTPCRKASTFGDTWIVGSDQVWRCWGGKFECFYMLNFLPLSIRQKSFSYAASFGTADTSLFISATSNQITELKALASNLKTISVREISGVDICRQYMGVDAKVMPDPTLLLQKEDYMFMIQDNLCDYPMDYDGNFIAYYILDMTPKTKKYLHLLDRESGLPLIDMSYNTLLDSSRILKRPIEQWLDIVNKASYIVTDSFHGCVFAILFNKPFVCLGNSNRGAARFLTLLKTFSLENRMSDDYSLQGIQRMFAAPIDWEKVNDIRAQEQVRGIEFLKINLIPNTTQHS